jgi:hypothetical protein
LRLGSLNITDGFFVSFSVSACVQSFYNER